MANISERRPRKLIQFQALLEFNFLLRTLSAVLEGKKSKSTDCFTRAEGWNEKSLRPLGCWKKLKRDLEYGVILSRRQSNLLCLSWEPPADKFTAAPIMKFDA
jgi:hypothetical protein